jgi:hypothetical protein
MSGNEFAIFPQAFEPSANGAVAAMLPAVTVHAMFREAAREVPPLQLRPADRRKPADRVQYLEVARNDGKHRPERLEMFCVETRFHLSPANRKVEIKHGSTEFTESYSQGGQVHLSFRAFRVSVLEK